MGEKPVLMEESILGYLGEGWRFRRKKVGKKYEYIVMRRKGVDRGMGPFDEGVWSLVERLQRIYTGIPLSNTAEKAKGLFDRSKLTRNERLRIARARDRLLLSLGVERGHIKSSKCLHVKEGYCTYWIWDQEKAFFRYIEETHIPGHKYLRRSDNNRGWTIRADGFYCANCSAYCE
jgi:hypothetical protein